MVSWIPRLDNRTLSSHWRTKRGNRNYMQGSARVREEGRGGVALNIAGFLDQSGLCDAANATLQFLQGSIGMGF